jgi:hypothetical protein
MSRCGSGASRHRSLLGGARSLCETIHMITRRH